MVSVTVVKTTKPEDVPPKRFLLIGLNPSISIEGVTDRDEVVVFSDLVVLSSFTNFLLGVGSASATCKKAMVLALAEHITNGVEGSGFDGILVDPEVFGPGIGEDTAHDLAHVIKISLAKSSLQAHIEKGMHAPLGDNDRRAAEKAVEEQQRPRLFTPGRCPGCRNCRSRDSNVYGRERNLDDMLKTDMSLDEVGKLLQNDASVFHTTPGVSVDGFFGAFPDFSDIFGDFFATRKPKENESQQHRPGQGYQPRTGNGSVRRPRPPRST